MVNGRFDQVVALDEKNMGHHEYMISVTIGIEIDLTLCRDFLTPL